MSESQSPGEDRPSTSGVSSAAVQALLFLQSQPSSSVSSGSAPSAPQASNGSSPPPQLPAPPVDLSPAPAPALEIRDIGVNRRRPGERPPRRDRGNRPRVRGQPIIRPTADQPMQLRLSGNSIDPEMSREAAQVIRELFRRKLYPDSPQWSKLPQDKQDWYWDEWKKCFRWDDNQYPDAKVKAAWSSKAGQIYRDLTEDARYRKGKPRTLDADGWKKWTEFWESEPYRKMCERNAKNRRKGGDLDQPAPATHTGGSITFTRHRNITGASLRQTFLWTHTVGNDGMTPISEEVTKMVEKYDELLTKITDVVGDDFDEDQLFAEATNHALGQEHRNEPYRMRSMGPDVLYATQAPGVSQRRIGVDDASAIQEEMQAAIAKLTETIEELKSTVAEQGCQISALQRGIGWGGSAASASTSVGGCGAEDEDDRHSMGIS